MNEAVWGLIGIGVGWLLNEFSSYIKIKKEDRTLKENVKLLLMSECEENKRNLKQYFDHLVDDVSGDNEESIKRKYVDKLCNYPLPNFSYEAYLSQLSFLGRTFKINIISNIIGIYGRFSQLKTIYGSIKELEGELLAAQNTYNSTSNLNIRNNLEMISKNKIKSAMELWDLFVEEKERILSTNPFEIHNN